MIVWSKEVFAKNLKKYMSEKNITQKELSEIVNVSTSAINDWIKAKKYPRIDKIEMLADYFGILKSDLIEEKSVREQINEKPVKMAELHVEMIMNKDFVDLFEDYKVLSDEQKNIVKDIVKNFARKK